MFRVLQRRTVHTCMILRKDSPGVTEAVARIQQLYVEAKDEYEIALDSQGTTYAAEDNETARSLADELYAFSSRVRID